MREFGLFTRDVAVAMGESVDYWLTMNEPMAFALFTYIEGTWPQVLGLYKRLFDFEAHVHESTILSPG